MRAAGGTADPLGRLAQEAGLDAQPGQAVAKDGAALGQTAYGRVVVAASLATIVIVSSTVSRSHIPCSFSPACT